MIEDATAGRLHVVTGASVLVTGGSGSFGRAFIKHILSLNPKRIVVYSRGEHRQEEMERELGPHPSVRYFIGDVRNYDRLEMAVRGINIVVHAAAMKVVPKCEYDPIEAIHTNILGAENVVRAAIKNKVSQVLALSTDKACAPVNLYGATKLAAEKLFMAAHNLRGSSSDTRFSVVRYGNVMDSQGSVAPLFRQLAREGKPFPVTDERMTRFIITMPQAIDFVIDCLDRMNGREIFVPKLPSVRIIDLATAFGGNEVQIVGIRPGEKLHETLVTTDEMRSAEDLGFAIVIRPGAEIKTSESESYTSGNNNNWLRGHRLQILVSENSHG